MTSQHSLCLMIVHKLQSINTKELLAIKFGLESFASHFRGCHVLIFSDNMTAISAIKKRGSCNLIRDALTREIFALTKPAFHHPFYHPFVWLPEFSGQIN